MNKSVDELERWAGGYPGEHATSALSNLERNEDTEPVFDAATKLIGGWQGNRFTGVYLYGPPGNGKTHAAIALGRALHDEIAADVTYAYTPELLGKRSYESPGSWSGFRNRSIAARQRSHSGIDVLTDTFPGRFGEHAVANRKQVLILDDYKPDVQASVSGGVEAAAQFGGLVIITSNHPNPFKLVEPQLSVLDTATEFYLAEAAGHEGAEMFGDVLQQKRQRREDVAASLRSRIAAGFKFIEFTGPDRRPDKSFWA